MYFLVLLLLTVFVERSPKYTNDFMNAIEITDKKGWN